MKSEIAIGSLVLVILALFLNPTNLLMPDSMNMALVLILSMGFLIFVGLIWREQANDEREAVHRQKAGRVSFLVGAAVLMMGIVTQALQHKIDPWLIYALATMVLTKLIARVVNRLQN